MARLAWYFKRLSVMSPVEIVHRVLEQWRMGWMRLLYSLRGGRAPASRANWERLAFCTSSVPLLPSLDWSNSIDESSVECCLAGSCGALGYRWRWRNSPEVWHEAPDTNQAWPQEFFGSIPYRAGNPYGDIRVAWEPSRLQSLVDLSVLAGMLEDERGDKAVSLLEQQFLGWNAGNPPWRGIHYISAMECGLRIISVAYALDRVRQRLENGPAVWSACAKMVDMHARLIEKRLSLHSSAGNHTVAEGAGLVYAGLLFPEMKGSSSWLSSGLAVLEDEADRQVLPDGGGVEQAFWYLLFVIDLYGLVEQLLLAKHVAVPRAIRSAIERGRGFLGELADNPEQLPAFGDNDGGYALSRHLRLSWNRPKTLQAGVHTFRESGYSLIRLSGRPGFELILDHGPLGMSPSFGHGHCDALSVVLSVKDRRLLIDPGTYTYNGDRRWRSYFRSMRSHNTITVDGKDPARQVSPFQWARPFSALLHRAETDENCTVRLLASHDGYRHLGLTHWRYIVAQTNGELLVLDFLDGQATHELELNWHLVNRPLAHDGYFELDEGVTLTVSGGPTVVNSGEISPISGWMSPLYGIRKPAFTLTSRYAGKLPFVFATCIGIGYPISTVENIDAEKMMAREWMQ